MFNEPSRLLPSCLHTPRLALRTLELADADTVLALAGDWDVARMLADMPHPMTPLAARQWTGAAMHDRCLAVLLDGRMIGSIAVCLPDPDKLGGPGAGKVPGRPDVRAAELGFWLGRDWWGCGYAREAAGAVVAHVFAVDPAAAMTSGRFIDNPASGRVLTVLGFEETVTTTQWCMARGQMVPAIRYALTRRPVAETVASADDRRGTAS